MYGIIPCIWLILMVHVGKYIITWILDVICSHIQGCTVYTYPYPSLTTLNLALDIDEMIHSSLDESAGLRLCFTAGIPWWRTAIDTGFV